MIRSLAIAAFVLATASAGYAQEASTTTPAATDIRVDPSATINVMSKQANMLTGIYATQAVIDICAITVPEPVATKMGNDRKRFETGVGLDATGATEAYEKVKTSVTATTPDCAEGSADRKNVEAVLSLYAGN
ncbi:MAG: hypothetical protein JWR51_2981 [Devosia sp.]|uniref:hypothetical protein n=1 Tax=Devosia sp. TaxID=1871048 RepID=UPI002614B213|nr:hypothetical protein [Devosia sp.]MDB5529878.1 hypothetical protein [Devosia sp.]